MKVITCIYYKQCSNVPNALRFDCHPEDGISELSCASRGCCWNPLGKLSSIVKRLPLNVPYCYYPRNWSVYKYDNFSRNGNDFSGFLKLVNSSTYQSDLPYVKVEVSSIDDSTLRIKMYDPVKARYEPPWPVRTDTKPFSRRDVNAKYKVDIDTTKPGFKIYRASDNTAM